MFHSSSPQHGTYSAWNGVAGGPTGTSPGATFTLTQDVTIPAASTASIQWKHRFQLDNNTYCDGTGCGTTQFAVEILNTSNVVLQTLYVFNVGADQVVDTGWISNLLSLNSYAGQTIRLRFRNTATADYAGPGLAEIDAVSIQSPSVPVAATADVGGRVTAANGMGIRNVTISLTDSAGQTRFARTNAFGYYNFDEIEVGQTVTLTVNSKRHTFTNPTRIISVTENVGDADFVSIE